MSFSVSINNEGCPDCHFLYQLMMKDVLTFSVSFYDEGCPDCHFLFQFMNTEYGHHYEEVDANN